VSTQTDPALWLIIELIACIQVAVLLLRRLRKQPVQWVGFALAIAFGMIAAFGLVVKPSIYAYAQVIPEMIFLGVPLVLGAFVSRRTSTKKASLFVVVVATAIGVGMNVQREAMKDSHYYFVKHDDRYYTSLARAQLLAAATIPPPSGLKGMQPLPSLRRGYIDTQNIPGVHPGPIAIDGPRNVWHTPITGLYARELQFIRLWTPGGDVSAAILNAEIVPVTPSGEPIAGAPRLNANNMLDVIP